MNWGETYVVQCPICQVPAALHISHRWSTVAEDGKTLLDLVRCDGQNCFELREAQSYLYDIVCRWQRLPAVTEAPQSEPVELARFELPWESAPVSTLPATHHAIEFLRGRGFDPDQVFDGWDVRYCERDWDVRPPVIDRLVIPVYQESTGDEPGLFLAGWQARLLDPEPSQWPKYVNPHGMKKNRMLYNLPTATRTSGPVVLAEGTTDVWRIGLHAVAAFGKTLSQHQRLLIRQKFVGRPIVIMLDADAIEAARKIRQQLQAERSLDGGDSRVVIALLPPGARSGGLHGH